MKQTEKRIAWPHGCQSAAMVAVMLDAEFIWLAMSDIYDTPKHRSMGEYGPRRGVENILGALENYGVRATFFVPGAAAERYPETVKRIAAAGHEIALHGYRHEDFARLAPEEQREAIARVLAMEPSIILADEPTGNLDSSSGKEIMEIIRGLWEAGNTIVLITHDTHVADQAQRKIYVRDGEVSGKEPTV